MKTMNFRACLVLATVALAGCGSGAVTPSVSTSPAADVVNNDFALCSTLLTAFAELRDNELLPIVSGATPDVVSLSGKVGSFAAKMKEPVSQLTDPGVKAAWSLSLANGEIAANSLLSDKSGVAASAISTFIKSARAGVDQCAVIASVLPTNISTAITTR